MPSPIAKRISTPAAALLAAVALTLTGCSGDGSKSGDGKTSVEEGPLTKYLSALWDGEEYTQEQLDADTKKTEDLVAECMSKEGFEYTPNLQNGGTVYSSEDDSIDWGSKEFAEQYGYGIVSWPGMEDQESAGEEYVDPNQDYIDSLSESEQQAYYEALYGPGPTEEEMAAMEEGGGEEYDWTTAGCQGAAQHEVQSESNNGMAAYEDPEFADLFAATNEVWNTLYDDENPPDGVVKLNGKWSDCMADAGYPDLTSPNTVSNDLSEEYSQLQMPDGENGEYEEPTDADKKEFQKREIEIATADFECRKKIGYEDEMMKLQNELEQQFVDEHKAELEALVAKYGTEKKK
ncbi:MAG: hypothetical protein QM606_05570 [Leucobacter sp.]